MTTHTSGAADLPEALRPIQRFEVVDCIDSKHVPAVIPKPHGPWVRYEDHVAALAAGQVAPHQWDTGYPPLPDPGINTASHAHFRVIGYTEAQMCAYVDADRANRTAPPAMDGGEDARPFPAMSPELSKILGTMCFQCITFAQALRAAGHQINTRAEDEQAAVLHWMLGHYFRSGEDGWREAAADDMKRMGAEAAARAAQKEGEKP